MALRYYLTDTAEKMADSLINWADEDQKQALKALTVDNFNDLLDEIFQDGGETRCERFCDLGWEYSCQFGKLESPAQEAAHWKVIQLAIEIVVKDLT